MPGTDGAPRRRLRARVGAASPRRMTTTLARAAALTCLLGSIVLTLQRRPPEPHRQDEHRTLTWPIRSLLRRYDRSAAGRRIAARLWQAQIDMEPSSWRGAQALVALPAATLLV